MNDYFEGPLMMVDKIGRRHAFFITMDGGKYVAFGSDQPVGNRSFISPRQNTRDEAMEFARQRIMS